MVLDCLPCLRKHNSTEPVGSPIDLYYCDISPPSRAVLMTAREFGINLNHIKLDLMAGEHMKTEFIKINFMHTVPTIVDDKFTLWESHPIMLYFCNKYAQNDRLYPCDPQKRALVDRMLYFDLGTLYNSIYSLVIPKLFGKVTEVDTDEEKKLREALVYLDSLLETTNT
ncbi:glutathione S-transferase 1-like [Tachypleus tridentatus]|uniref:glutathione S-transferase 1-like n=1 Tax=Tachypleus tridentatus TaxID=6853 RepID=UPI003FD1AF99